MSDPVLWKTKDPTNCNHEYHHVCEHGFVDHCRYGPIFCGDCGTNLSREMDKEWAKALENKGNQP